MDPWFADLLESSYHRFTGRHLSEVARSTPQEAAEWLYTSAPFGLLAHDGGADPRYTYANRTAQQRFGYSWEEFVGMPSWLSAASADQTDRNALLQATSDSGHVTGYRGLRVAKSGRRFWIEDVTMWNLVDADGVRHGQAAVVPTWTEPSA
ncbi:MEKHLA domain-containing protein [Actinoallomurus purpureus]|uniref:MEKHLA domain-containing protein n=1 Tax=Actinoallomurus purpureus TaxID=478114 RepID=UPI002093CE89|nr:MEKHLA domain-containing protein [Actinoallomurus purpureus]MCO6004199.1 MEKHLA domain-containing protein [Actinoallomurus purpureus]